MSILELVQLEKGHFNETDTLLRREAKEVTDFGDDFQKIVDDLLETFNHHEIAVGLAAPQVGVGLQVAIINPNKKDKPKKTRIIVNPVIISTSGKKDRKKEACMSLPHFQGEVERRKNIEVKYQDRYGEEHVIKQSGFLARIYAHEIDHLEGYLYVDRMDTNAKLEPVGFFKSDKKS